MPDWKSIVCQRLQSLRMTAAAESDLADELAQHLEDQYRELLSGGATPQAAHEKVMAELDDTYPQASVGRNRRMPRYDAVPPGDVPRGNLLADVTRDLRYAVRNMRRSPGFVMVVVLTLALGIGANTTVFTVINTLILNPLPVHDPGSLAAVSLAETQNTSRSSAPLPMSYRDLKDYQARNAVFQSLAGYSGPRLVTWQEGASASQRLFCELVTGNYFATAGIAPAKGRFFFADGDSAAGAHPVAVVNYGTWQMHFGGAPDIVGKTLRLNHIVFTVVGVAPPKFIGINGIFGPDLWIPAAMAEQLLPNEMTSVLTDRSKAVFQGMGRLQPGTSLAQAQANLAAIAAGLAREFSADEGRTATAVPIREALFSSSTGSAAPVMFGSMVLFLIVGIVLLIACSNVANLLLARSAGRQQEMAVRVAMGASRSRVARQLLTESVFLGLLGGALGLGVGYAGLQLLFGMLPGAANFIAPKLDVTVLLFALVVSLATGLLFGSIPAIKASRAGVADALKEESRTTGRSRRRVSLANALLVTQVAFSFLLLVTAALFLRSIGRAYSIDPGFQTDHLAIFMTNPGQAGYAKPQAKAFYKDAAERVARLPGVASVSWSFNQPLWARSVSGLQIEGREQRSRSDNIRTIVNTISPKYFETAGVTLEQGREFTDADRETSAPVAIVNEKLAQDYWPGRGALGKRIRIPGEEQMRQIVGIARNANYSSWAEAPQLCVYVPLEQKYSDGMTLYARSKGDPRQLLVPVEREIKAAGPQILVGSPRTGREVIDGGLFQARTGVTLLTVFGLLALGLASIGLYGILAYSVNQRKREIGLRMALGAAQGSVLRLILKQGMTLVLAGMAIGFAAALVAGRLLSRMLFGVGAGDPLSVAAAALVLLAVALWACYLPARRASRVDPLVALREG